jgi:uncharacterized OB-fold protein
MSAWEPRPTPEVTPETERFWTGAAEGEFLLSSCDECGLEFFYPRALCPDCFGSTSWTPAEGTGTVYTYTVAEKVAGWPEDELPLVSAYVELTEGPRVLSNLVNVSPEDVSVGMPVTVTFIPAADGDIAIPVFEPA